MSNYNREDFIMEAKNATHAFDMIFMDACDKVDVPWRLMKAQGFVESRLNPEATSSAGARGIMQLMRPTFRDMAGRFADEDAKICDPRINIHAGVKYFMWCRERFESLGRLDMTVQNDLAFASYLLGWKRIKNTLEYSWVMLRHRSDLVAALNRVSLGSETLNYIENIDIAYAVFLSSR